MLRGPDGNGPLPFAGCVEWRRRVMLMHESKQSRPARCWLVASVICVGLPVLSGCDQSQGGAARVAPIESSGDETSERPATTVEPIEWIVHQETVADLPGASVVGFESTVLVAKQAGYVEAIGRRGDTEIDIGVAVEAGSVLAELDIPELAEEFREKQALNRRAVAEVAQAQAALEIARSMEDQVRQSLVEKQALRALREIELQRISRLVKMGAADLDKQDEARFRHTAAKAAVQATQAEMVTAAANIKKAVADVNQAEAEADVAEAGVKRLEALNSYRVIKAPFDGVVVARHVDPGAFVRPAGNKESGSPLFEVARIDRVRIVGFVPPSQINVIRPGRRARFHHIGGFKHGAAVSGQVDRSAMALDPSSRKMRIEMHVDNLDADGGTRLSIGQFGTLSVLAREWTDEDKLPVVPASAIGTDKQGRSFVVVVEGTSGNRRVLVETVAVDQERVGAIGELRPGDRVRVGDLSAY